MRTRLSPPLLQKSRTPSLQARDKFQVQVKVQALACSRTLLARIYQLQVLSHHRFANRSNPKNIVKTTDH